MEERKRTVRTEEKRQVTGQADGCRVVEGEQGSY